MRNVTPALCARRVQLIALALALCVPATAIASRAPSPATRAAILAAIHHKRGLGDPRLYRVENVRVSTRGPYARARTVPRNRALYQGQLVILRDQRGRWRVTDFGTAGVGCGLPRAVQRDLRVTPPASYCSGHPHPMRDS
ncbi:MAG: hypothetical protein ACYC91_15435 [Solirubrobacteraceae bacterium]